jgi:hypothetical protein
MAGDNLDQVTLSSISIQGKFFKVSGPKLNVGASAPKNLETLGEKFSFNTFSVPALASKFPAVAGKICNEFTSFLKVEVASCGNKTIQKRSSPVVAEPSPRL